MKPVKTTGIFLLLLSMLAAGSSRAQTANEDLRKVNAAYGKHASISMNITYTLYNSYTSTSVRDKENGTYIRQGEKYYSKLLGVETMSNANVIVVADHNDKVMLVADPPKMKKDPSPVNIDSILTICGSVKHSESATGQKVYTMTFENRRYFEYSKIEIYINSQTWLIDKMLLYYKEQVNLDTEDEGALKEAPRLEITYSNINTNPAFEKEQFSENKFIVSAGQKLKGIGAYSGFEVINQKMKKK